MWQLHLPHSAHQAGLLVTGMRVQRPQEGHGSGLGTNWAKGTVALPRKCSVSMTQKGICAQTWTCNFLPTMWKAEQVGWEAVKNALSAPSRESCPKWEPADLGCFRGGDSEGTGRPTYNSVEVLMVAGCLMCWKMHGWVWETGKPVTVCG